MYVCCCRYEDLAGAAVKRAEDLYSRLEAPMPPSVRTAMVKNDECARATRYTALLLLFDVVHCSLFEDMFELFEVLCRALY